MNRSPLSMTATEPHVPHRRGDEPQETWVFFNEDNVPHRRGDEPIYLARGGAVRVCSPQAWG